MGAAEACVWAAGHEGRGDAAVRRRALGCIQEVQRRGARLWAARDQRDVNRR